MRNFFLYTPLLPTCTMGSIEERSIVTPIREMAAGKADFLEARCEGIDVEKKVVRCSRARRSKVSSNAQYHRFPDKEEGEKYTFEMPYDILIYGVGAKTNDFNVPGVKQHSFYFKDLRFWELIDARNVRSRISDLFEEAALPTMSPEDRDALLNFIIVGGGPTGVEIAADLADFVDEDCKRLYPKLQDQVTINLVNMEDHLLSTYSRDISEKSLEVFKAKGVKVLNGWRVTEITEDVVKMTTKQGDYKEIPHGCVIWAAGVKPTSLTQQVKADLQGLNKGALRVRGVRGSREAELQAKVRGLSTDEWLNVWGSKGSIFALGDASTVQQECACFFAQELFQELFSVWLGHMFHGKNLMIVIMSKCGYGTLAHPRGLNGAGHARETVPAELGRRRTWRTRDASASTRCETCFGATRSVGGPALVLSRSSIHVKNALRLFRASMWHTRILYYYMILYVYCIHTCNICNILYIV
ncbi:unnamed protein product [Durusdinium trenchii]|uniref:NADH:ubiquinone reductase (non-electrogenic) n=1 Tax=Durusdinium trenchii TaxID=1381693 RepID=A0ABP0PPH5_9DINO